MRWLAAPPAPPKLVKRKYREQTTELRKQLLLAQADLRERRVPVITLVAGVDGAGKGECVELLNAWLDPRWIRTRAFDRPTDEETERPHFWRYWRALPPRGDMALYLSAWYSLPLLQRVDGLGRQDFADRLERIRRFERMLSDDGYVVSKIWLHLERDAQVDRFERLQSDPLRSWRVTQRDWDNCARYPQFVAAAEELIEASHTDESPWTVIDGSDVQHRNLALGNAVLSALRRAPEPAPRVEPTTRRAPRESQPPDDGSPPEAGLSKREYQRELAGLQGALNQLHRSARARGVPLVAVFEGRDASGKGGAIRRVVPAFDPRCVDVVRTGPPNDEESEHHYLWRFWRRLPRAGHVTLFDRSWYGRVLVERVERLADEDSWLRAYDEINEFEHQLTEHGVVLVKFWMDVSPNEQARRFAERQRVAHKRWKFTPDDLRNRSLWDEYDAALADVLSCTDTPAAPWTVVPADDKRRARLNVLRAISERLETHLSSAPKTNGAPR